MKAVILFLGVAGALMRAQTVSPAPAPRTMHIAVGGSYIGVMVEEIDSSRAQALKLPGEYGVEITRVEPDSPAQRAGLKAGDAILEYNGQRVEGMEEFKRLVNETPVGREVKLDIVRNGAPQAIPLKVASRQPTVTMNMQGGFPNAPGQFELHMPDIPRSFMSWRSAALGIEAETLEGQLAQYFGVKQGVLVRSVMKGSAAEKAGMKAGDVITRIDDSDVATPADISSRIRSLRGKQVPVVLMRDHKETTLSVTVSDDDRSQWGNFGTPQRMIQ